MTAPARKILIAMDGTKSSDYAFDFPDTIVKQTHSQESGQGYIKYFYKEKDDVIIVHVAEHPPLVATNLPTTVDQSIATRIAREEEMDVANLLNLLNKKIQNAGIKGNVLRMSSLKTGEMIVTAGDESRVDMIITGSHGPGKKLGSVSQYVVQNAHVPVLVVRQ